MEHEDEAEKLLEKMGKELAAAIPEDAAATLTYMDGDLVVVRVLTAEDFYSDEYLRRRALFK